MTAAQVLALFPPVILAFATLGLSLTVLATVLVVSMVWEVGFGVVRGVV